MTYKEADLLRTTFECDVDHLLPKPTYIPIQRNIHTCRMTTTSILESAIPGSELYSFDAPPEETVPLLRLSLRKLQDFDPEESQRLFEVSKDLGFFYLDLTEADTGSEILQDVGSLFAVGEQLFQGGGLDQWDFSAQGSYFG